MRPNVFKDTTKVKVCISPRERLQLLRVPLKPIYSLPDRITTHVTRKHGGDTSDVIGLCIIYPDIVVGLTPNRGMRF